jgi:AP-1 complex subunit gamma-1
MAIAGQHVPEEVSGTSFKPKYLYGAANLVALIASTPDLYSYATQKMFLAMTSDFTQQTLSRVCAWCIGEFGELLVNPGADKEITVTESSVIDLLESVIKFPGSVHNRFV